MQISPVTDPEQTQSRSSTERIIASAQPIFAMIDLFAQSEKEGAPDPTPEQIALALRGAVTIGLSVVFAIVSIADNLQRLAVSKEAENGIWPSPTPEKKSPEAE